MARCSKQTFKKGQLVTWGHGYGIPSVGIVQKIMPDGRVVLDHGDGDCPEYVYLYKVAPASKADLQRFIKHLKRLQVTISKRQRKVHKRLARELVSKETWLCSSKVLKGW